MVFNYPTLEKFKIIIRPSIFVRKLALHFQNARRVCSKRLRLASR